MLVSLVHFQWVRKRVIPLPPRCRNGVRLGDRQKLIHQVGQASSPFGTALYYEFRFHLFPDPTDVGDAQEKPHKNQGFLRFCFPIAVGEAGLLGNHEHFVQEPIREASFPSHGVN